MSKQQDEARLGNGNIWSVVLSLAIPTMLAQFVNVLYSIVDRIYIGNMPGIGDTALAGVGICGPIVTLIASFGSLVGLGGAPLMAIKLGEQDRKGAKQILANGFLLLTILSVLLTAVVFLLKNNLLLWFGASQTLYPYANEYLTWYAAGTLFSILSTGLNSFIICQGFGKIGMLTVMIGAVANIVLDPVFIFLFGLGVKGAAIATVLSQMLSTVFAVKFLFGRHTIIRISWKGYSFRILRRILLLGLSPFLIIATDSVMILALNGVLQKYGGSGGDNLIAAATIMLSFMQIITLPMGGITSGTQPVLSYNYGAGNSARVRKGEACILILCLIFTTVMFLIARFASVYFVKIFTRDEALIAMSVKYIHIYTLAIIPLALQYTFVDGLTALGIAPAAISLSLFRKIAVMLTLTFLLPQLYGAEAVFYAEPIADVVSAVSSSTVFFLLIGKILKKRERQLGRIPG